MSEEEDYFKDKKTGWIKPQPGGMKTTLVKLQDSFKKIIESDNKNLIETLERLKHVLEKRNSKNTDT